MQVTLQQLKGLIYAPNQAAIDGINATLAHYNINTPLRVCHFLAQVLHESGGLKYVKENLNYSANGLLATFPTHFPNISVANQYARQPAKIADRVYADRMGNGNEASGDGWKYCGRGYIQITGKTNYSLFGTNADVDFINHPELIETPDYAAMSAGWFWNSHNLNTYADRDDIIAITRAINGGTNGLSERQAKLAALKKVIF